MSTHKILENYAKINHCKGQLDAIDNIALPAIDRIKDKINTDSEYSIGNILQHLRDHIDDQNKSIRESSQIFDKQMIQRNNDAKQFVNNKSDDELKLWLADQYVPYNSWKDATHDTLLELVFSVYE